MEVIRDRELHEECGVFGIYGVPNAASLTYYGLHALQHRGQEGAGIVSVDEIERLTGLDFFPNMQKSLQTSLEADVPTRLWPIRALDLLKLILVRLG